MLLPSTRYTEQDFVAWQSAERADAVYCQTAAHRRKVTEALGALRDFLLRPEPCYVGVSWGKDSVVVAHLAWRLRHFRAAPLIWFPAGPLENPDNALVRDAFLLHHPADYREILATEEQLEVTPDGHDGFQAAFEREASKLGSRYVSGVRAEESAARLRRGKHWGHSSPNTCAPLIWWEARDVFAYLCAHGLPVHPAYACTLGGTIDRGRIRVATLGGRRGTEWGRREHEERYYGRELRAVEGLITKRSPW